MKLRKLISILLFAVYLFAAGGAAWASISCHCIAGAAEQAYVAHSCCAHCDHEGDLLAAKADLNSPCCGDHHSTEITLYTTPVSESEKYLKCIVTSLPPSLAVECPCPAHVALLREKVAERRAPFVKQACVLPSGFRAPPVLA